MQETLAANIQFVIDEMLRQLLGVGYPDTPQGLMRRPGVTANRIAYRLIEALAASQQTELHDEVWKRMIRAATKDVLIGIEPGEPPVTLGNNKKLLSALADFTAYTVAPAGSDWAFSLPAQHQKKVRSKLTIHGISQRTVNWLMTEYRNDGDRLRAMKNEKEKKQFSRAAQVPFTGLVATAIIFIDRPARFPFFTGQGGLKAPTVPNGNCRDNTMSHSSALMLSALRSPPCCS
jgi:hypothetical protein